MPDIVHANNSDIRFMAHYDEMAHGVSSHATVTVWEQLVAEQDESLQILVAREQACRYGRLMLTHGVYDNNSRVANVSRVFVAPFARQRGIGSMLVKKALEIVGPSADVYLKIKDDNEVARRLYERHGFVVANSSVATSEDIAMVRKGDRAEVSHIHPSEQLTAVS